MKNGKWICALLVVGACAPIAERVASRPPAERAEFLAAECEDESWRGHDVGEHYHYTHRPENKEHAANVVKICRELSKPASDKRKLIEQCKTEAEGGTYKGKFVFQKHVDSLKEICDGFSLTQS